MKSKFTFLILFFLLLNGKNFLQGQDTSFITSTIKWDLATAIAYAKQHNIQVNITKLDERLSEQDLLLSRAAKYPDLSGSATQSITHRNGNTDPVVGGFQTQSSLAGNYSLSSSWVLFRGGYFNHDIRSKTLQLEAANLNTSIIQNDITLQLTEAYLNILVAREAIIYAQDLAKTSQSQYDLGKIKFDKGSISKKDLLQLEAQVASDQYNLVTAQNQYRQNVLILKQVLQLPTTTGFEPIVPDTLIVEQALPNLLEAQRLALQNRPEVQYNNLQVQIAETELQKAKAGYKPTLSTGGSVSTGYSDNQDIKYFSQVNNNFFQRVGLTLSIPILDNRTNKTNVERSKILIEQSRLSLEQTKTVLNQQVEQAYIAVLNSLAQFKSANVQLKANQEAYNISLEQLRLGAINNTDLLVQRNLYIQSLQNFIQSKYNSVLNTKIYEFYMGRSITL